MIRLQELLAGISHQGSGDAELTGIATDSRKVKRGDLFVALPGHHVDGHDHAPAAERAGAAAVLAERPLALGIPLVMVQSTSTALSPVSARFYGHPSRSMRVAGVTGTNGKTTITYMLEHLLAAAGRPAGVLGTIEYRWPGRVEKAVNTTPLAADVQRLLASMLAEGVRDVAMEVSSHSLNLGRVEDVAFSVGIFTNLTQDHLDFHNTMDAYFEAKARLFELLAQPADAGGSPFERRAIINMDDPWGAKFHARLRVPSWTYAIDQAADFRAENPALSAAETSFRARTPAGTADVRLPLVGRHNIYNALAAFAGGLALGLSLEQAVSGLASISGVPGRLERVLESQPSRVPFGVFVDYAHTEDALHNVLSTLRPLTQGKVIALFGCGGDRDKTKRPRMGETAAKLADYVVVTSDNPRSEDPVQIAKEVEAGVRRVSGRPYEVVVDRAEAIGRAIALARPGDVVLLAGKGHETYQIFKDRTIDFDDREVARGLLRAWKGS